MNNGCHFRRLGRDRSDSSVNLAASKSSLLFTLPSDRGIESRLPDLTRQSVDQAILPPAISNSSRTEVLLFPASRLLCPYSKPRHAYTMQSDRRIRHVPTARPIELQRNIEQGPINSDSLQLIDGTT